MESDSKISNNPFFRGFRRENSDFFPLSSRHSSIFVDRNIINPLRSSGLFNNRRGSDVSCNLTGVVIGGSGGGGVGVCKKINNNDGEPILTDFIKRNTESSPSNSNESNSKNYGVINNNNNNNNGSNNNKSLNKDDVALLRPRREKTESDIVLRHTEARRGLKENLEIRRKELECRLNKEADNRRRSSKAIDSLALSTATNSISGEDYLYIQQVISYLSILFF